MGLSQKYRHAEFVSASTLYPGLWIPKHTFVAGACECGVAGACEYGVAGACEYGVAFGMTLGCKLIGQPISFFKTQ